MNYKKAVYDSYLSFHNKHLYGAPSLERFNAHKAVNDFNLNPFLPNNKQAAILDIGCGDGNLVYWLQQKGYNQAQGVDVSAEQIESGLSLGIANLFIGDLTGFLQDKEEEEKGRCQICRGARGSACHGPGNSATSPGDKGYYPSCGGSTGNSY